MRWLNNTSPNKLFCLILTGMLNMNKNQELRRHLFKNYDSKNMMNDKTNLFRKLFYRQFVVALILYKPCLSDKLKY